MKQTRKTNLFKKLDLVVMEKYECIYLFPSVLYFMCFKPRCNGKASIMYLSISKCFIFCFTQIF